MTLILQLLDLTVNGYAKRFMHEKFNSLYSLQLSEGKLSHNINVSLKLSLLKPIHAERILELYDKMTTIPRREIIHSSQKDTGITDILNNGIDDLEYLDPFQDIEPMMEGSQLHKTLQGICNFTVS